MGMGIIWFVLVSGLVTAPVFGGLEDLEIDGNTVTAQIKFGLFLSADLTIEFEDAEGLTEEDLGLSAQQVSPLDLGLLARLPTGTSIPAGFPVLVHLHAPETGDLSFQGVASVELDTSNLIYSSTLRLFAAPSGGDFVDVTAFADDGSFRARGLVPDWGRCLLVGLDPLTLLQSIGLHLDLLDGVLESLDSVIETAAYGDLEDLLEEVRDQYEGDDTEAAIEALDEFVEAVVEESGDDVPDVWTAGEDLTNAAGELRTAAAALRFHLVRDL